MLTIDDAAFVKRQDDELRTLVKEFIRLIDVRHPYTEAAELTLMTLLVKNQSQTYQTLARLLCPPSPDSNTTSPENGLVSPPLSQHTDVSVDSSTPPAVDLEKSAAQTQH